MSLVNVTREVRLQTNIRTLLDSRVYKYFKTWLPIQAF